MSKHNQAKEKAKKLILRVNRGCQAIIWQEIQYKQEQYKEKNTPNLEKEESVPQYGHQFCYMENLSMSRGEPQNT